MRKVATKIIICVVVVLGALWIFGPREPASLQIDYRRIAIPDDVDAYLSTAEARFDDIVPGTHKRVSWFGIPGEKTPVAIVYIHGFSASSEELRPVPDLVAKALGANLYFTRLTGHGRGSAAMAGADYDLATPVIIAKRLCHRHGDFGRVSVSYRTWLFSGWGMASYWVFRA